MNCSHCEDPNPNFLCGNCETVAYCDSICQRLHQFQHVCVSYHGTVASNGKLVLDDADEDQLFHQAIEHVKSKKLNWNIQKPEAWTKYGLKPYISLNGGKWKGEKVDNVTMGKVYHFVTPNSRWVALSVTLPQKYACPYECSMSIGQERIYSGIVKKSGSYLEIALENVDADELYQMALQYVKEKGLVDWKIRKPYAWTDYGSSPHVTLNPKSVVNVGDKVQGITLGKLYHFKTETSRWVAINVNLPKPFTCEYECHMSIGQQRL